MILFLNHKEIKCGVYQYGYRTSQIITQSQRYDIIYAEVGSLAEYWHNVNHFNPVIVIYNYYPSTMPWLSPGVLNEGRSRFKQVAIFHEVPLTDFDYYIRIDPTEDSSVGRPLMQFETEYRTSVVPIIGTFGFGLGNNDYPGIVERVNEEFDWAVIRLQIPFAAYGDVGGAAARSFADSCRQVPLKPGIKLEITHDFMPVHDLLEFLAENTINAFFYQENYGRGPSSTIDYALSVKRPIAITKSYQFKHLEEVWSDICVEDNRLRTIIGRGTEPLERFYTRWSPENLIKDYENILERIGNGC